jgi:hypothetical protein
MKTYLVYDQKSGNIVHVHNETGESRRKPEDVLRYVHPSVGRAHLESVEIESGQMRAGESYKVNPKTKKLESAKAGVNSSAGAQQAKAARR